jgi:hypothetical protein
MIMAAILNYPSMTPAQLFVMRTFATAENEQEREELTSLYLDYIQKKLDKAANQFWDDQNLDNSKMEELMYGHLRSSK